MTTHNDASWVKMRDQGRLLVEEKYRKGFYRMLNIKNGVKFLYFSFKGMDALRRFPFIL